MGMNDFQIGLVAKLDGTKSKNQLNADIEALKKQLTDINVKATLGKEVVANIAKQLNATQISLQNVNIDQTTINKMVSQINNALSGININLGQNIGNNLTNNLGQQSKQAGQIVSREVESSLKNITSKEIGLHFEVEKTDSDEFNKAVDEEILKLQKAQNTLKKVRYTTNTELVTSEDIFGNTNYERVEKLTGAIFSYNTQAGEAINKTMKWAQIGITQNDNGEDVPLMGWVQGITTYNKSLDEANVKTDTFLEKQSRAVNKAQNTLASIQSDYTNQSRTKPIKDTTELENQYKKVNDAITNLGNADKSTFTQMQNNVDTEISKLRDMVQVARDAQNVSLKMRGTDYETGKSITTNDFEKFKQDSKDFPKIASTVSDLEKAFKNIGDSSSLNEFNDKLRVAYSELSKLKSESSANNKSNKLEIKKSGLESQISNLENLSPEISKFKAQIAGADVTIQTLKDDLVDVKTQGDFSVVNTKFKAFTDSAKEAGYAVKDLINNGISKIRNAINVGDYDSKVVKLAASFKNLGYEEDEVARKIAPVKTALDELKKSSDDELVKNEKLFNTELKKSQNEVVELKFQLDKIYNPNRQFKLKNDIQNWLLKNTKATKRAKQELESYYRELDSGKVSVERLEYINKAFENVQTTQRGLGKLGKNLKDQMTQAVESFSQWLSISSMVMLAVTKVKDAISELKDLDDIITEISKTSDLTNTQLKELGDTAFESASKYGKSASDYLTGVQEMYRAGFDNAPEMSELSILAQSAGDMTSDAANDYLIATSAAYDYQGSVEKLNEVLDGQNYITNNAAVAMDDMADATSEAASIANQYGVSIEELSSLIAVATAKTRESGSETGNALKSLFINLQDTTSKPIREAFEAVGISMTKMVNGSEKLKTPIELLKELSKAFNGLPEGDTRRANILSDIGGKWHANTLSAILSDFDSFYKMMDLYGQGSGSAIQEAEKSSNNLSGSLAKLNNTWTDTVQNFVDSDDLKIAVNLLNDLLTVINKITEVFGSFGSIGLGAGLVQSLTGHGKRTIMFQW